MTRIKKDRPEKPAYITHDPRKLQREQKLKRDKERRESKYWR